MTAAVALQGCQLTRTASPVQVRVPETGGRILIASDGVWDAFEKMLRVSRMSRSWHTEVGGPCCVGSPRGVCAH